MLSRQGLVFFLVALLTACSGGSGSQGGGGGDINTTEPRFVTFDSGQVRPLALSPDSQQLLAVNTPAGQLEIFNMTDTGLDAVASVPVGLEPVAVSYRNNTEAWVVNHLSDSVSVVDLSANPARVVKTLLVGDEPRDIVFAGEDIRYAYISTAHRGQNGPDDRPMDAALTTPGVGRTDVWVFDSTNTGASLGGDPTDVVSLFGDTARALAVSPDNNSVFVAVMNSGNRSTVIGENNLQKSGPTQSADGVTQPDTGLIVQFNGMDWIDETGASTDLVERPFNGLVPFTLPDYDVFEISANATPSELTRYSGVGTTLFNMIVNPVTESLYVSNTEALNVNRFEGPGIASSSVNGNFIRNRLSVINRSSDGQSPVVAQDLNTHINRSLSSGTDSDRALSISQPMGMDISSDGSDLFVAGFGSSKLFVYDTNTIGSAAFQVADTVELSGGGPTGVVLDESRNQAYVLTRFNNSVSVVNINTLEETQSISLQNPEPEHVVEGRPFLYNAEELSRFGDMSCASCHIFGDTDQMAWDLGNPDGRVAGNPNEFVNLFLMPNRAASFHPMKGPMATQSLRGMKNAGPMHWRGDRTGVNRAPDETLEIAAFKEFNEAFVALLGRDSEISESDMDAFAEYALELSYPPNPIRALDNSLTNSQRAGENIYFNQVTTGNAFNCNICHTIDLQAGQFGTSGKSSVEGDSVSQEFKVPHIRNMYQKVGKFGNSGIFSSTDEFFGDQIRGFGFMHDGNMDTLINFFKGDVFAFVNNETENNARIAEVVDFVMASDSELAPIVGQQVTLSSGDSADTRNRLNLLIERAVITQPRAECDLIAQGIVDGEARGYFMDEVESMQSDRSAERVTVDELLEKVDTQNATLTFTCVPPGSGVMFGIDRDDDGVMDGDTSVSD